MLYYYYYYYYSHTAQEGHTGLLEQPKNKNVLVFDTFWHLYTPNFLNKLKHQLITLHLLV